MDLKVRLGWVLLDPNDVPYAVFSLLICLAFFWVSTGWTKNVETIPEIPACKNGRRTSSFVPILSCWILISLIGALGVDMCGLLEYAIGIWTGE